MKLILTRHGQTIENKEGKLQGHTPGTLTEEGIEQAQKLALRLKNEKIDEIYSSDLARSADTAKIIARFHDVPLNFVKELREADLKDYTGMDKSKIDWNNLPKGIESKESMYNRIKKLVDKVYSKHPNGTVLFVGHGNINRAIIAIVNNKPADELNTFKIHSNTALSIFEIKEDNKHIIHLMNSTKHLE